jgi:hypothetical protein
MAQLSHRTRTQRPTPKPEPLRSRMVKFSPRDQETLAQLSKDLHDYTGRAVSSACVLRALVRVAATWSYQVGLDTLTPHVEAEVRSGIAWGNHPYARKRKRAKHTT